MRKVLWLVLLVLVPGSLRAASKEISGPTAVISPYTYWCKPNTPCTPQAGRFYNPAGIQVGSELYMYVQGGVYSSANGGPGSECSLGEEILLFKSAWTAAALRSPFSYVKTVSPCNTSVSGVHYQLGSVFRSAWDNKIKLLVDETEGGTSVQAGNFKRVLLGSSSDGQTFTWTPFIKQSSVNGELISIIEVTLVQATANSNWWGVFKFGSVCGCESGRMRVTPDATNPRGYVISILASDNTWKNVADDGSFNFRPLNIGSPGMNSIVYNNNTWEGWGDQSAPGATAGCYDAAFTQGSTFAYRTLTQSGPVGSVQTVTSDVRPMPTVNGLGRLYPFRLNDMNGARLLYSASRDRICTDTIVADGFRGMEVVVTVVDN
jgi:hypothetical protein